MSESRLKSVDEILPFILVIVCVASARFVELELAAFFVFIATLAVYVWRRYDSRILVGMAILLIIGSAIVLAVSGAERYADKVAAWAYYFLVIGILGLLISDLRERWKRSEHKRIRRR